MNTLYVVPTPIGNIKDITQRAINIFSSTQTIICEDTRVTKKLFQLLKISIEEKIFFPFFAGQEDKRFIKAIELIESGNVVLVSDAGTPTINDPGNKIINFVRNNLSNHIKIEVLPGANAPITALVASGMPTNKFAYIGFFPKEQKARIALLNTTQDLNNIQKQTFIALESVHRIKESIEDFKQVFSNEVRIALCRELTKMHEQVVLGSPEELLSKLGSGEIVKKGEFTLVFRIKTMI